MNIAIIAGSNRLVATSTKMARYVGSKLREAGHEVAIWELYERPLPFYDPSADGEPEEVEALVRTVAEADAVILATPEYHGSISGILKNALDFLGSDQFGGKMVLCISSAGGAVGVSSLQHMQVIIRNVHGVNCPEWLSIGGEQRRFDENGVPESPQTVARVDRVLNTFVRLASKLRD